MVTGDLFKPERYTFASEWVRYIAHLCHSRVQSSHHLSLPISRSDSSNSRSVSDLRARIRKVQTGRIDRALCFTPASLSIGHIDLVSTSEGLNLCVSRVNTTSTCPAPPLCTLFSSPSLHATSLFVFCKCSEFFRFRPTAKTPEGVDQQFTEHEGNEDRFVLSFASELEGSRSDLNMASEYRARKGEGVLVLWGCSNDWVRGRVLGYEGDSLLIKIRNTPYTYAIHKDVRLLPNLESPEVKFVLIVNLSSIQLGLSNQMEEG